MHHIIIKAYLQYNIISTKLNDTFGAQNVENARKISDDILSNPFVRFLTMFMFRRKM